MYRCTGVHCTLHMYIKTYYVLLLLFSPSAPPSNIEIQGYAPNSKVEVRESQDLTLTCIVSDAKPAAQIQWFRNNIEIKTGNFYHSFPNGYIEWK